MENTVELPRIDNLIPYKEPTFAPKRRMGKLDLTWSVWAIAAKLGRYLLSGADESNIEAIAESCAAWALGVPTSNLSRFVPSEEVKRSIERNVEGPYSCFLTKKERSAEDTESEGNPDEPHEWFSREKLTILVVAHHGKAKKRASFHYGFVIGHECTGDFEVVKVPWRPSEEFRFPVRAYLEVVKLPTVLGLMEIVSAAGSVEALRDLVYSTFKSRWLEGMAAFRHYFEKMDQCGRVVYGPAHGAKEGSVKVPVEGDDGEEYLLALSETLRLYVYGSPSELEMHAEELAAPRKKYFMTDIRLILSEDTLNEMFSGYALRKLAQRRWDEEACRELNRRYMASNRSADIFEDKKHCNKTHRAVAQEGYLAETFHYVEVDDDVDLSLFQSLVEEFRARDAAGELPQVDKAAITLRFRKCGRHHALGAYSPALRAVAVDPRSPRSLLHEFAHAYDFEKGQLSTQERFHGILEHYLENFKAEGQSGIAEEYYETPTEVFARAWEVFAAARGLGGSFVDTMEAYRACFAYRPLIDAIDMVDEYFLDILAGSRFETD